MDALERIDLSMSQLDYVVKCWDAIIEGPEGETYGVDMAIQFANHYNGHHVKHTDKFQEYLNDKPTQAALKAYGIDPEKFWYLLLMAADYTENYGAEIVVNESASSQLTKFCSLVEENLQLHPALGVQFSHDPEMKLTLTVKEKGKKRNTVLKIDSPNALGYLSYLIQMNNKSSDESLEAKILNEILNTGIGGSFCGKPAIPQTERLACFTQILLAFLKPLKATPGITTREYPRDKYYLISQYAYMMGLTCDTAFINPLRPHYLQDYIKDQKDFFILNPNLYYTFDIGK